MAFLDIFSKKPIKKRKKQTIIIDNRERNSLVASYLMEKDFQIEFKQLPVADYIINSTAIERKTISDLKSSIINKRIVSQLLELKQYPSHFLLIEGPQETLYDPPLHENALRGFLLSVALEFKTPLIFSKSPEDTANYISVLAKKITKKEYSIRASKIFRSNKEQAQFILEGFPHIGPNKARLLLKKFKTLKNIFDASPSDLEEILGKRTSDFVNTLNKKI